MPERRLATSIAVRDIRARILLDDLLGNPELVERLEDIARLPRLAGWTPCSIDVAVADNVADGVLTEAADGRICVRPPDRTGG